MADYYELLGAADADADTLKRAYRRLARQYHPDINKDPGAEDRFKEIGRAYEVLSDPQTRGRYDQFGEAGLGGAAGSHRIWETWAALPTCLKPSSRVSVARQEEVVAGHASRHLGDDLRYDLTIDFEQAVFGQEREIRVPHLETCTTCGGSGAKPGSGPTTCGTCGGAGQVRPGHAYTPFGSFTQVAECPTCNGSGQVIADPCRLLWWPGCGAGS